MEQSRKEEYVRKLTEKGVNKPCPRCPGQQFDIVAETHLPINDKPNVINIGGPTVPSVIVACSRCGFITLHAQGPLGMNVGGGK